MPELPQDPTILQEQAINTTLIPNPPAMQLPAASHPLPAFSSFITVKLTQNNFPIWKTQVVPYLRAQGLYQHVYETLPCPPTMLLDGAVNPGHTTWVARDKLVMAVLTSSLTESVLVQIMDCTTAAAIWSNLHDLFSTRSSAQVVHTRLQLASLKKGSETVTEYFNRAKGLVTTLAGAGHHIPETEFAVFLLAGLPTEYESLVTSLSTQPLLPSPTQILSHLLVHESRLNHQSNALLSTPASANNTTSKNAEANHTSFGRGRGRRNDLNVGN